MFEQNILGTVAMVIELMYAEWSCFVQIDLEFCHADDTISGYIESSLNARKFRDRPHTTSSFCIISLTLQS